MYKKDLTEDFRIRMSKTDMDFLRKMSEERSCSISECVRSIIGEYRRSLDTLGALTSLLEIAKSKEGMEAVHGNTKSNIDG